MALSAMWLRTGCSTVLSLRLSKEFSFVLPGKLHFVDSKADLCLRDITLLKDSVVGQQRLHVPAQGKTQQGVVWCGIDYLNRICIAIIFSFPVGSGK